MTLTALALVAALLSSGHILLSRRAPGSTIAWMALVWLAPLLGSAAYLMLGINRIQRRAESLGIPHHQRRDTLERYRVDDDALTFHLTPRAVHLVPLRALIDRVVRRPLVIGNAITPLFDGDGAYPEMLRAIDEAKSSVTLVTYIFDNDEIGRQIVDALARAHTRGVHVRVLIDAAGLRYSFPSILRRLKRARIPAARFLPSVLPPHIMTVNLRNHRKIMVIDGHLGFTGGINIRDAHRLSTHPSFPVHDLHFKVQGPVVTHLQEVFAEDWEFTTGEHLKGDAFFPEPTTAGQAMARGIADGPDEDLDRLRWTMVGAIASARERVRIMTPYFIPDDSLITALNLAALRGVQVDILLPSVNNLVYVQWASMAHLGALLEWGCNIYFSPPPFHHSKLMVVDGTWFTLGSANMDPRSLRLNFEFNLECWDPTLGGHLDQMLSDRISEATPITLEQWQERPRWKRLRDGAAALLSPYL
ncbi:cardiolipin synthase [Lujinxingia litoralis]|uniref:Cardiolipin synthase n=2 Tax=Lujinxingia litoralis TaxID=2211119 RepID=A0A328C7T9_9DELT|nr:cardiolipin synthase [Lujinxingia litoralis]